MPRPATAYELPTFAPTAPEGGYLDLDSWRHRDRTLALEAAGLAVRGPYPLRHSFAYWMLSGMRREI